jgi:uncharacterized Zn finger protein
MKVLKALFALFGLAAGVAVAQLPEATDARQDVRALLHLDASRAARVEAILDTAREKIRVAREQIGPVNDEVTRLTMHAAMEAIRSDTDQKLGAILTEDELDLLHAYLPLPAPRLEAMRFKRV